MQNTRTDSDFRLCAHRRQGFALLSSARFSAQLLAPALCGIVIAGLAATPAGAALQSRTLGGGTSAQASQGSSSSPSSAAPVGGKAQAGSKSTAPAKVPVATPITNKPLDASGTAPAVDPTPEQIGTGGVVELTSVSPEEPAERDSVIIPTELDPGTQIPPTKRASPAGRALGKPAAEGALGTAKAAGDAASARKTAASLGAGASESSAFMGQVVPTALALAGTIAAIFLAKMLMKRFGNRLGGGKRPSGVVEVLARYPFARGHHIVLIKVGRRVLVTHQSAQGIQTLSEFTSQADVADLIARCEAGARGTEQFSFDSLLRNSDREFDAPNAQDRRAQKPQRSDPRSTLPASVRGAEIETIDLTRRRGVMR
jgi:flagellar biogenesis protein FliO